MIEKYELSEKFGIDVNVYLDEEGEKPLGSGLPDSRLTKDFIRLYFSGKIEKVWKDWVGDRYWARTITGEKYFLKPTKITASEIEAIIADKRGGRRPGSGPKSKIGGMHTKTMRVPSSMQEEIKCLIDIYAHWLCDDPLNLPYQTDENKRLSVIKDIIYVLDEEKKHIMERRRKALEEEDNKRQLKLFSEDGSED